MFPRAASDPIQVGPYTLTQCIGQGGMAVVYKGKRNGPAGFEKTVVVKAMLPGLISRKELVDLFRAEAKLSAQLNHPNIVQVHDFGVADGVPFLVMEYLNGRNLTQLRAALVPGRAGRLPVGAAITIARDVCLALGYAHDFTDAEGVRRQVIHRDVSPSNVMVCRDGSVKLLDFGVAKVAGQFDCDITQSFRGKYAYMSPEQVNRQPIDRRVDVFACGIILHEMLTGKRLFAAASELETLERVSAAQVVAPSVDNPEVPRALDAIVKRALSRDPGARYASGTEMAEALEELEGLAFPRRKLAAQLMSLFPDAWSVICEVCGKQVPPGSECGECGTAAPDPTSENAPEAVLPSMAVQPPIPSEPLPLPPPPVGPKRSVRQRHHHTPPRLRVVRPPTAGQAVVDPQAAFMAKTAPPFISLRSAPPASPDGPRPPVIDRTPVEPPRQTDEHAATWLSPMKPSTDPELIEPVGPSPAPHLFVVPKPPRPSPKPARPADDDSVKMGRGTGESTAPRLPVSYGAPPAPEGWFLPIRPVLPAVAIGRPQFMAPMPLLSGTGSTPAPDLRKTSNAWKGLGVFVMVVGLGLSVMALVGRRPTVVMTPAEADAPAMMPAAEPPPAPVAPATVAPVVVAPAPVAKAAIVRASAPVAAPAPAPRARPHRSHHKQRAVDAPAPRGTVKEGRIVDPFAGSE